MKPKVWIEKIKFSDDSEVPFDSNQITVFVGPNNVGKSASLKELNSLTKNNHKNGKVIKEFEFKKKGNVDELLKFLQELSKEILVADSAVKNYIGYQFNLPVVHIGSYWSNNNQLSNLHPVFVNLIRVC